MSLFQDDLLWYFEIKELIRLILLDSYRQDKVSKTYVHPTSPKRTEYLCKLSQNCRKLFIQFLLSKLKYSEIDKIPQNTTMCNVKNVLSISYFPLIVPPLPSYKHRANEINLAKDSKGKELCFFISFYVYIVREEMGERFSSQPPHFLMYKT